MSYVPRNPRMRYQPSQPLRTQEEIDEIRSFNFIPRFGYFEPLYEYKPLPTQQNPDTIRLLELLPGKPMDPVCCKLSEASLTENPLYEALSYCWGDAKNKTRIMIDNPSGLEIQCDLYDALYYLRHRDLSRILWVDAICINQKDDNEKNSQVQLMREIYAGASRTVVWLGVDPDVEEAFKWLNEDKVVRPHKATSFLPSGLDFIQAYDFSILLQNPYFERVWVIQEVVVSSEVQVMCMLSTVSWDVLVASAGVAPFHGRRHQNLLSIAKARKEFKDRVYSLPSLLSLYRSFNATNPRDKIYAMLGIVWPPSPKESRILPDYAEATPSVYISVAKSILKASKNLDFLSSCSRSTSTQPKHTNVKTPSWVPNWIATGVASPFIEFSDPVEANDHLEVTKTFSATKESKSKPTFPEDHPQSVRLRGHFVDVVDTVGMAAQPEPEQFIPCDNGGWFMSQLASYLTKLLHYRCNRSLMFIEWEKITKARSRNRYITSEDMLEVYWKTLAGGYFPTEDTEIWSKEKVAMEYTTSQDRYLSYLGFHHSYAAWAGAVVLLLPITATLFYLKLIPFYLPLKRDVHVHRRMFTTQDGYIGLGPKEIEHGDQVALLEGGKLPFIIRQRSESESELKYELIGECYIHGIMSGERYDAAKCKDVWII